VGSLMRAMMVLHAHREAVHQHQQALLDEATAV
jgi:hypothetical protein